MLYHHWNLWDSMYHSSFVMSKLALWTAPGLQQLKTFIAKIGVPLEDIRRPYHELAENKKQLFNSDWNNYAASFGLKDGRYQTFFRVQINIA